MAGQPKAPFYLAVFLVVVGLVGFALYRADIFAPKGQDQQGTGERSIRTNWGRSGHGECRGCRRSGRSAGRGEHHDGQGIHVQAVGTSAARSRERPPTSRCRTTRFVSR